MVACWAADSYHLNKENNVNILEIVKILSVLNENHFPLHAFVQYWQIFYKGLYNF